MTLDTSGFLLEGIRIASGNSPFSYPPRNIVSDYSILNSASGRAEYVMFVGGQALGFSGMDIGNPTLFFSWSRNNGSVTRFDYDSFSMRWSPMPGSAPEALGVISNTKRLVAPIPDFTVITESPYSLYIGYPVRLVTFSVSIVATSDEFTDPPSGSVQISNDAGEINFSSIDIENQAYLNQQVYVTKQNFFSRSKSKGVFGALPASSIDSYSLFLNPMPGAGQTPRLRIGYRPYLSVTSVATESLLSPPAPSSVVFSLDTGKVLFSLQDIDSYPNSSVYYDGVTLGKVVLERGDVGVMTSVLISESRSKPVLIGGSPDFIGLLDPLVNLILDPSDSDSWESVASTRFAFFLVPLISTFRYYFRVIVKSSTTNLTKISSGSVVVDSSTGSVYARRSDVDKFRGSILSYVDTLILMEQGASVQVFRSGVNTVGFPVVSDFIERYEVSDHIVHDGISQSPMVMLPTVPTVDSDLEVFIGQASGGGGTFVGELVDGTDPLLYGNGYVLDLDIKQLKFSSRKSVNITSDVPSSTVKLPDSVIFSDGLEVSINGTPIEPGIDFDFNKDSGLIEFVDGIGEDDPNNIINISGDIELPNKFIAKNPILDASVIGRFLFIQSGDNVGLHPINVFIDAKTITVGSTFKSSGAVSADVRTNREIIADRFWNKLSPPLKKIAIYRKGTSDLQVRKLEDDEFSVIQTLGQINIVDRAKPGDTFRVEYIWSQSNDEGVTIVPTPKNEYATFKIRQEEGVSTVNSPYIKFNPDNKTVISTSTTPIIVYIENVTADPTTYVFLAPNTIVMNKPLGTDGVAPLVIVDYYVSEATGGEGNFTLQNSPIEVDYPVITGRDSIASPYDVLDVHDVGEVPPTKFNGDHTQSLFPGGAILVNETQVFSIGYISYDPVADVTVIDFSPAPEITLNNVSLQFTGVIYDVNGYIIFETSASDTLEKGGTTLSVQGNRSYKSDMVFFIDEDPYRSISTSFNQKTGHTDVVLASPATRNYILPQVKHTIRPVLGPESSFQTYNPANTTSYPFTLVKSGPSPGVLRLGADYNISENGLITLTSQIGYGDVLEAMYVYNVVQPAGTVIGVNYAFQISPGQYGISGQKLILSYNLYSPDTFFYRRESILSFIPEVIDEMKGSVTTGSSTGPNISNSSSLKTKDMGNPSLYYNEQHISNVDTVIIKLLKFYNDLINNWEDILSDIDGRVVGGTSGKFRFDGLLYNPAINNYYEITNDIDDLVQIYTKLVLTNIETFTFEEVPVYARMYESNSLSRIFPTAVTAFAALNDKVDFLDFLKTMGSFKIPKLTSAGAFSPAPALSEFITFNGGTILNIPINGDKDNLIPKFEVGQPVLIYRPDGSLETVFSTIINSITAAISPNTGLYVTISVPTTLRKGGIVQDVSVDSDHFYSVGGDLNVDFDNGNIKNFTLPPLLAALQNEVKGKEIIQSDLTFSNTDIAPRRIPVLDGQTLIDSGRPSIPPLSRISESGLLSDELIVLGGMGNARVAADLITLTNLSFPLVVGSSIQFVNGLNAGVLVQIAAVPAPTSTTAVVELPIVLQVDAVGSDFIIIQFSGQTFENLYSSEIGILNSNVAVVPLSVPPYIGNVNSELISIDQIILSFGQQTLGTGTITSATELTDTSVNFSLFSPPITTSSLVYVQTGANRGLYKVASFTSTVLTVSTSTPYVEFPSIGGSTPYIVIQPWSFLSSIEYEVATKFLSETLDFYESTFNWATSPVLSGLANRYAAVKARQDLALPGFIESVTGLLTTDDDLYDIRYIWIQQRTDKKEGTTTKRTQFKSRRVDDTKKLVSGQKKLLIAESLKV